MFTLTNSQCHTTHFWITSAAPRLWSIVLSINCLPSTNCVSLHITCFCTRWRKQWCLWEPKFNLKLVHRTSACCQHQHDSNHTTESSIFCQACSLEYFTTPPPTDIAELSQCSFTRAGQSCHASQAEHRGHRSALFSVRFNFLSTPVNICLFVALYAGIVSSLAA